MPFGLRNAGATYQRLVEITFHEQIGRNIKVYVDDLVIKSCTEDEVVCDIEETFKMLRKINMKLNPKKCTFGVEKGMFLGYQVNTKGIKICPDKVDAILSLQSPKCLKDVQKLNGKLAKEAEAVFRQMKEHIAKLPMLTAPEEQEELIVYLAASKEAVSPYSLPNSAMLLLSSKTVMKRPKHSSSSNDETKQDLISNLPDALLTHILSLLPDADACRMSVLSNRWKDLWMFLPSLHFVMPLFWSNKEENELYCYVDEAKAPVCWSMEEVYKFYNLVDKTLALRDGMPIQSE
ncbi:reverse transcriptase domain-containing protein [Tanacetum coccineum]